MAKKTVSELKTIADNVITSNNNREITGDLLNKQQKDIIDSYDNLVSNSRELGDGAGSDKYILFNEGSADKPGFRWNNTTTKVQFTNDGTTWQDVGAGAGLSDGDYGDVTVSSGGTVITIDDNVVTNAKLREGIATSILGRSLNSTGNMADIQASSNGQVLRRESDSVAFGTITGAGIANEAVANAKLENMPANTVKANVTGSTASPTDFQITANSVLARAGANIVALAVGAYQVLARYAGDLIASDTLDIENAGKSCFVSESNGLKTNLIGRRYVNFGTVNIPISSTNVTVFSGADFDSVTGAQPTDTTDYFCNNGALKAGSSQIIRLNCNVTGGAEFRIRYAGATLDTITGLSAGLQTIEVELLWKVINSTTGVIRVITRLNGNMTKYTEASTLNTVADSALDVQFTTTSVQSLDIYNSEIIFKP